MENSTDLLIPLDTYINDLRRALDDAEWEGDDGRALCYEAMLKSALEAADRGEVYYVAF